MRCCCSYVFRCSGGGAVGGDEVGEGDSDEEDEEETAAFERAVTEVLNRVMQDADKKPGGRGGGVQSAAFESLQVRVDVRTVLSP